MTKRAKLATGISSAGVVCALLGLASVGLWRGVWLWTACSCAIAATAYARNRPALLGKRNGRLAWWRALPLLPYLAAFWIGCFVRRIQRRCAPYDEVAPGIYVGGRVGEEELPANVELILDLAAEWGEPTGLRTRPGYRDLAVLDGSYPPDEERLLAIVEELAAAEGRVYIHCEAGVGRAPTAAALVLIARGVADGPEAAIEQIRKRRPVVRLTRSDIRFIRRVAPRATPVAATGPARAAGLGA